MQTMLKQVLHLKVMTISGISAEVTVDSKDAVVELTWMYLQRVTDGDMRRLTASDEARQRLQ